MNPDDPAFGPCYGLTIRQYYEIECLKGLLSDNSPVVVDSEMAHEDFVKLAINTAVEYADALIRAQQARDEKEKKS